MSSAITSLNLIKILKGDYYNSDHEYSKFYFENKKDNGITININDQSIMGKCIFDTNHLFNFKITLSRCTFINSVNFNSGTFTNDLTFDKIVFNQGIRFQNTTFNNLYIADSNINIEFNIRIASFQYLEIEDCKTEKISINGGSFGTLVFKGQGIKNINIWNRFTFINKLHIYSLVDTSILIEESIINKLFISGDFHDRNNIKIQNIKINEMIFNRVNLNGKLSIENIQINHLQKKQSNISIDEYLKINSDSKEGVELYARAFNREIDYSSPLHKITNFISTKFYSQLEDLMFLNIENSKSSKLEFNEVSYDKLEFKNVDLQQFITISVINTDLSRAYFFRSTFPTTNLIGTSKLLYETFNDLFLSAKNQNNRRDQILYYKASRNELLKSLLTRNWINYIPSIISLGTSKLYSDFGSRWTQSLISIIILSILFFSMMILTSNYDLSISMDGFLTLKKLAVYYLYYLNPTHKIYFMDNQIDEFVYSKNFYFVFFDLFGRILIGIGIYELIKSFRKYVN